MDDFLNKRRIKDRAPSEYMAEFARTNRHIAATMKTHLIEDLDRFGVWSDDYDAFLAERAKLLSREIGDRIIEREEDARAQPDLVHDASEEPGAE